MKKITRYEVFWIEHHSEIVEAKNEKEAEELTLDSNAADTYNWAELDQITKVDILGNSVHKRLVDDFGNPL